MKKDLEKITKFLYTMNGLKHILRFKDMPGFENTNIERWDSVAEHSYRMALMAVLCAKYLDKKIDLEKTLKIILVHDIVELIAKDYSPVETHNGGGGHAFDTKAYKDKYKRESEAAKEVFSDLPKDLRDEFISLWKEYAETKISPEKATNEAKYAYAIDKLEATMQITEWRDNVEWDKEKTERSNSYAEKWSSYDKSLKTINKIIREEMQKMEKND